MFDDLKNSNDLAPAGDSGSRPNNMSSSPAGPTADMFAEVDPTPMENHLEKPSAVQLGKLKPINATSVLQGPQITAPRPVANPIMEPSLADLNGLPTGQSRSSGRKIAIIIFVTLLVGVAGWSAYLFFNDRLKINSADNTNTNDNQIENTVTNNNDDNIIPNIVNNNATTTVSADDLDDDSDGLSNAQEATLGSNPNNPDTDNDALSDQDELEIYKTSLIDSDSDDDNLLDYDEVRVWKTDPLQADSDSDGYSDGIEVENGYNPLGTGTIEDYVPPLLPPL